MSIGGTIDQRYGRQFDQNAIAFNKLDWIRKPGEKNYNNNNLDLKLACGCMMISEKLT